MRVRPSSEVPSDAHATRGLPEGRR